MNAAEVCPAHADGRAGNNSMGSGLFRIACRAAHSCQPNCVWFSSQNGDRIMRTVVPVAKGEELFINYMDDSWLIRPVSERRKHTSSTYLFVCECPRCAAHGDDTRWFPCQTKSCSGHHLGITATRAFTICDACGNEACTAHVVHLLQQEANVSRKLERINDIIDSGQPIDITQQLLSLEAPHPYHYLAAKVADVQRELYSQTGNNIRCEQAIRKEIRCLDAVIKFPTSHTAFR